MPEGGFPAPTGAAVAPGSRAVVELLAWLDAVDGWLARDVGQMLPKWYDVPLGSANGPTIPHPTHAAATVRGLVEEVGRLEQERDKARENLKRWADQARELAVFAGEQEQRAAQAEGRAVVAVEELTAARKQYATEASAHRRTRTEAKRYRVALVALADHPRGVHIPKRISSIVDHARAAGGDAGAGQ